MRERKATPQPMIEGIMKISIPKKSRAPQRSDEDLDRAVRKIYQTYGSDLSAFSKAVRDHFELARQQDTEKYRRAKLAESTSQ